MPYPFPPPTTSQLSLPAYVTSSTHPSLPLSASSTRAVVRSALKHHQRLPLSQRPSHLPELHAALLNYLPYLSALLSGLNGSSNTLVVTANREIEVQWSASTTTLSSRPTVALIPGKKGSGKRVTMKGLDAELGFVLHSLAIVENGLARSALRVLYAATTPTAEQKDRALGVATRHLLQAGSIWMFWAQRQGGSGGGGGGGGTGTTGDVDPVLCGALAALALAEATLCAVRKDDPYPGLVTQERDKSDMDWMYKAPEIPKSRALLDTRLCLAAAEHAGKAVAGLGKGGRDGVERYAVDLRRVCRCRAARFFGMDAEMGGKTGEAIAWLRGGRGELSDGKEDAGGRMRRLTKEWGDKREGKKVEAGGEWGLDAGKGEEQRVLDMLDKKWVKMNNTMNTQAIPDAAPLIRDMPLGRDMYTLPRYALPTLDEETLIQMEAPAKADFNEGNEESSDDEDDPYLGSAGPAGAFPGTGKDYNGGGTYY